MKIIVTDTEITVHWFNEVYVSDYDELVRLFQKADEHERRRIAVNLIHSDSSVFQLVSVNKSISNETSLSTSNFSDMVRLIQDDDLANIDNPHWICE